MHPILFRLPWFSGGGIPFHSYGVLLGLSLVVGWFLSLGLAESDGLPREALARCYIDTALSALLGARLLYIATNPSDFTSFASLIAFRNGGLVAYGGFLGGLVGSFLALRYGVGFTGLFRWIGGLFSRAPRPKREPISLLAWADCAVPSLASGLFITRIGCYLFGCDFGKPLSESAPSFLKRLGTFPHWPEGSVDVGDGAPAWAAQVHDGLIPRTAPASLPVHPTQLYESLTGLVLLVALLWLRKHRRFRGEVFLWFAFLYGSVRFALEIVRDDAERGELFPAAPQHLLYPICLGILGLGYAMGIAPRIRDAVLRIATQIAAFAPAMAMYIAFRPQPFVAASVTRLSTSQVVGFTSGLAAAIAFAVLDRKSPAEADPVAADAPKASKTAKVEPTKANAERADETENAGSNSDILKDEGAEPRRKKRKKRRE